MTYYYTKDRFHPLGDQLPRPTANLADPKVRLRLLHKAEQRRLWKIAVQRCLDNPYPGISEAGRHALVALMKRLNAKHTYFPSFRERNLVLAADWKRPCSVAGCSNLAHLSLRAQGWCREHEGSYWHARRVMDLYRGQEAASNVVSASIKEGERALMAHTRSVRSRFRRKSKRK